MRTKRDLETLVFRRKNGFTDIARELGEDHAITKMMGTLAWGRHKGETGAQYGVRDLMYEIGFLDGFFDCLNLWARDHDTAAQRVMRQHYKTDWHV